MRTINFRHISLTKKILYQKIAFIAFMLIFFFNGFTQVEYDSITVYNYRTNYPNTAFLCDSVLCDTVPCDGHCFSTYDNGQIYYQGIFENGQPTDTFKVFFSNGNLKELYIPHAYHRFYDKTGFALYEWNDKTREEHSFYKKNRIKSFIHWSHHKPVILKEYYVNGSLKSETNHNHKKIYDKDGLLASDITRKEVWVVDRVVTGHTKWYEYHHVEYDNCGRKLREAQYKKAYEENDAFPNTIDEVREYNMSYFYHFYHGKMIKKQTWVYQHHKGKYKKLHKTFLWVNNSWEEQVDPD